MDLVSRWQHGLLIVPLQVSCSIPLLLWLCRLMLGRCAKRSWPQLTQCTTGPNLRLLHVKFFFGFEVHSGTSAALLPRATPAYGAPALEGLARPHGLSFAAFCGLLARPRIRHLNAFMRCLGPV